jgi:hypothetical protein
LTRDIHSPFPRSEITRRESRDFTDGTTGHGKTSVPGSSFNDALALLRDDVVNDFSDLRQPEPLDAAGVAALFVRCLIAGSVIAVAAWLAINLALTSL